MSLSRTTEMSGWMIRRSPFPVLLLLMCVAVGLVSSCSWDASGVPKSQSSQKKIAVPVTVGMAVQKDVPVRLHAIGNVEAYSTVGIKAQVEGELTLVHFKEGQEVKAGDLLFRSRKATAIASGSSAGP